MNDYILFKNLEGKYLTLPECLELKTSDKTEAVDENGETVEAEVVDDNSSNDEEAQDKEPRKIIYYVTDEQQQSQYINMFKSQGMDAVILTHNIDQPFVSQLESKNEDVKFMRIDADLTESFKDEASEEDKKKLEEQSTMIAGIFKDKLNKDKLEIKVEKLKDDKVSSVLTISEESRRMQDMMKMYSMSGMDMGMFGDEGETLVLNANNKLVSFLVDNKDNDKAPIVCEQLYDLAKLSNKPLSSEEMTKFVARSNEIMMLMFQ